MKVKEKGENAALKLNIQKTKIMASSPITSWQRDREKGERASDCKCPYPLLSITFLLLN